MEPSKRLRNIGFITFFLSGICAISSGVIVSLLQESCGFSFSMTGTLLSCMSIGNMAAAFLSGFLPRYLGVRKTVLILCAGYFIGYLATALTGLPVLLLTSFLLIGLAKGCALNRCTVLVGTNSSDRNRGMQVMHACYAVGAMLCPLLITILLRFSQTLPMIGIAIMGLLLWLIFFSAGLIKPVEFPVVGFGIIGILLGLFCLFGSGISRLYPEQAVSDIGRILLLIIF